MSPMSNDQVVEIKNYMGILVEGLRDEIRIVANGVLGNTQSIGRLEVKVDHLEQEVQQVKYDLADLRKDHKNLCTQVAQTNRTLVPMKKSIEKLNKEVFG